MKRQTEIEIPVVSIDFVDDTRRKIVLMVCSLVGLAGSLVYNYWQGHPWYYPPVMDLF